jgi:phage gpG-like protein
MLLIEVHLIGYQRTIKKLQMVGSGLHNFYGAMTEIGGELSNYYSGQVFDSQGAVLGVPWPTLAASTVLYKRKYYPRYATTPLIRTGVMRDSFRSRASARKVVIDNPTPYFKYHQSTAPRSKIPYRPMMGINQDVRNIVKKIIEADIRRKIEAA